MCNQIHLSHQDTNIYFHPDQSAKNLTVPIAISTIIMYITQSSNFLCLFFFTIMNCIFRARFRKILVPIFTLAVFTHLLPVGLYGQDPPPGIDRATREIDRPIREEVEERLRPSIVPDPVEEEEPEPEPVGPTFLLRGINLEGVVSFETQDFDHVLERFIGRRISIETLQIITSAIEREYLARGIIAGCFVPPQDVEDGIVTLEVVEARLGQLRINEHGRFYDPARIHYYWDIAPGEVLRYDKMSKSAQLMNKTPDRTVSITLHAGELPGTTDVIMDVDTRFPVHVFGSFDREGAVSTGRKRTGLGIRHNNFLWIDDSLMMGSTFGNDFTSMYLYHLVPITPFGTSIMYGYSDSKSAPKKEFERFVIKSESQNYSFFIKQDVYRGDEYRGEVSIGVDAIDRTTRSLGGFGTLSRDRLRVMRLKSTLTHRFPGAVTSITPELSQGLNWLGARRKNRFSSRQASNTFTKFNFDIRHQRLFPMNLQAALNVRSQWAGEKLVSTEQLALGGINSVRGYPSQDYMADSGIVTNLELIFPAYLVPEDLKIPYESQTVRESLSPFLFFDWGWGTKRGNIQGEKHLSYLSGAGMGLRIRMFNQASLQLAWGFPLGIADKPSSESADSRFHISLNFEDQFHEEFRRITKIAEEERVRRLASRLVDSELNRAGSPLRKKVYGTFLMARQAEENGDLEMASTLYARFLRMSRHLEEQAINYVLTAFDREKALKAMDREARQAYNSGDLEQAKSLWENIRDKAELKPLVLRV